MRSFSRTGTDYAKRRSRRARLLPVLLPVLRGAAAVGMALAFGRRCIGNRARGLASGWRHLMDLGRVGPSDSMVSDQLMEHLMEGELWKTPTIHFDDDGGGSAGGGSGPAVSSGGVVTKLTTHSIWNKVSSPASESESRARARVGVQCSDIASGGIRNLV